MSTPDATGRLARPPRRASRRSPDLRLVLGVLLVVGSVAGVVGIVSAADRRVTVYAAGSTLTPGERIDRGDLVERTVALDGADGLYLGRGDIPRDGLVVTQPVARGELLATSSVGSAVGVRSTSIVLRLATRVSGAVVPGASVDLWSAPKVGSAISGTGASASDTEAARLAPSVLVSGATVARVLAQSGSFSVDANGSQVEVLVPRNRVARVLQAIANGDALALLPAGIPVAETTAAGVDP
jgi:hypothetical protein